MRHPALTLLTACVALAAALAAGVDALSLQYLPVDLPTRQPLQGMGYPRLEDLMSLSDEAEMQGAPDDPEDLALAFLSDHPVEDVPRVTLQDLTDLIQDISVAADNPEDDDEEGEPESSRRKREAPETVEIRPPSRVRRQVDKSQLTSQAHVLPSKIRKGFSAWGGKRSPDFHSWGGKRSPAAVKSQRKQTNPSSWEGKRVPGFHSWGGKRVPSFNSWGGKRAFSSWGGKRAFSSWGGKRAQTFNSWGGKRAPSFSSWGGKRAFNSWGGKRVPSFSSWGGKRAFNSWGGKRVPSFSSWGGKRAFNSWGGKRAFNSWGGKRAPAFASWGGKQAPFNSWGGKRAFDSELSNEDIMELLLFPPENQSNAQNDIEREGSPSELEDNSMDMWLSKEWTNPPLEKQEATPAESLQKPQDK